MNFNNQQYRFHFIVVVVVVFSVRHRIIILNEIVLLQHLFSIFENTVSIINWCVIV